MGDLGACRFGVNRAEVGMETVSELLGRVVLFVDGPGFGAGRLPFHRMFLMFVRVPPEPHSFRNWALCICARGWAR